MKSSRNRTLTVSEQEKQILKENISSVKDVEKDFHDNMIVHGDLFQCIKFLPDSYFDLIIADPPYNLSKKFNGVEFKYMPQAEYEDYLRSWFYDVCDKLKENGTLYMCGDWKCSSSMQRVIEERLTIINRITWEREKGRGSKKNWKNSMEDIWFAVKDKKNYTFNVEDVMMRRKVLAPYKSDGRPKDWEKTDKGNFRNTYPSNFWNDITVPFWSMPENTDHPTQKPEKLIAKLILASTNEGDKVFDPFLGSGTTAVVAKKLNRNYFGIELNEEYCLYSAKRLMIAQDNTNIQGYSDNVFWERNSI